MGQRQSSTSNKDGAMEVSTLSKTTNTKKETRGDIQKDLSLKQLLAQSLKVVIIGQTAVGKTSMSKRLMFGKPINVNDTAVNTIGAQFSAKTILVQNSSVRLDIWDTAGLIRFRSLTPMYARVSSAVLLCYDITSSKSLLELRSFLDDIDEHVRRPGTVVAFVGLKKDLQDQRQVQPLHVREFAKSKQLDDALFLEATSVDSKDCSVEEVFQAVVVRWLQKQGYEFNDRSLVHLVCACIARDADTQFGGLETLKATIPPELYSKIERLYNGEAM
eukprot:TRINITY_DN2545_c0_g1_i2.p1 TRINITY_DN2545_c0_g1~~TRINITY_DN2545_c0_g1_i2.p1  ORF type:complete len:274 (-),score=42.56 TRINITY_DN2545_c0_g1_i2:61-882(-)